MKNNNWLIFLAINWDFFVGFYTRAFYCIRKKSMFYEYFNNRISTVLDLYSATERAIYEQCALRWLDTAVDRKYYTYITIINYDYSTFTMIRE